jgi:simple sugar transport system ATP-binding protein
VCQELLRKQNEGCAILVASEELEDLFALSNRIAVMFRGRIVAVIDADRATYDEIGRYMAGDGNGRHQ